MKDEELETSLKEALLPKRDDELPIDIGLRHCTKALFYEHRHQTSAKLLAPYCLKDYDYEYEGIVYRSMYMIYMACDSEYEAGIKLLGSYSHWCKLKETRWFAPYVERWEDERNIRDEAVARTVLIRLAEGGNVTAASKIFANSKDKKKAGRPTKGGKRETQPISDDLESMIANAEDD